jgi:hypothetical protein
MAAAARGTSTLNVEPSPCRRIWHCSACQPDGMLASSESKENECGKGSRRRSAGASSSLGESLEGVQLLGGALILGSVASLQLEGKLSRLLGARASAAAVCKAPPGGDADGEASLGRSPAP